MYQFLLDIWDYKRCQNFCSDRDCGVNALVTRLEEETNQDHVQEGKINWRITVLKAFGARY